MSWDPAVKLSTLDFTIPAINDTRNNRTLLELKTIVEVQGVTCVLIKAFDFSRSAFLKALDDERVVFTRDNGKSFAGSTKWFKPGTPGQVFYERGQEDEVQFNTGIGISALQNYKDIANKVLKEYAEVLPDSSKRKVVQKHSAVTCVIL